MSNQVSAPTPTITTPGKPSAMGPPSDTPTAPRPAADARARAIDAARQAKRDSEGKFLPKTEPEAPSAAAEVSPAASTDSTPEAAEVSGEAAATPPPEESPMDVRTRVRQREQRIQRELEQRAAKLESDRAQFDAQRQQFETERQKYARLEQLRTSDPVAWAKEVQLDAVMEPIVKARLLAGKPEGMISAAEQRLAALEQKYEADRRAEQQRAQAASADATRRSYIQLAVNHPDIADVVRAYGNEGQEFIDDAYRAASRLATRRKVAVDMLSQQEILAEHVRWFRDRVKRAMPATPAPAPAAPAAPPKAKIPSPADAARTAPPQRGERQESDRERRQRAALEARKAIASTNKRAR